MALWEAVRLKGYNWGTLLGWRQFRGFGGRFAAAIRRRPKTAKDRDKNETCGKGTRRSIESSAEKEEQRSSAFGRFFFLGYTHNYVYRYMESFYL